MNRRMTLILGGARSGKSTCAQNLAKAHEGRVLYVATAEAGDSEMAARIAAHRAERPDDWRTLEAPRRVGAAIRAAAPDFDVILVDCITLLASNVIAALPEPIGPKDVEAALDEEIESLLAAHGLSQSNWIVVSNEVGLGLVPDNPLGRVYRDALGRANQRLAAAADEVLFMAAGLPLRLKGRRNNETGLT